MLAMKEMPASSRHAIHGGGEGEPEMLSPKPLLPTSLWDAQQSLLC